MKHTATRHFGTLCPVCDHDAVTLLARVWRNYHIPAAFHVDPIRWFAECRKCATVMMFPLHDDFDAGGTVYYDQADVDAHVLRHYQEFQKPNYDRIREFLARIAPAADYRRWLDVGSVGYPTTFRDYEFTTIEPDARAARAGESLFRTGRIHASTLDRWHDERPYDGVLFNNSFYCLTNPGETLRKTARLLRPGGRLVITSSSTFADAISDRDDGRILMIEDLLFGETVQVYYNTHSLAYLAGRHGFRLREVEEVPAYGFKTMRAHVFEFDGAAVADAALLPQSSQQMARVWDETLAGFVDATTDTLRTLNRRDVVLAGPLSVIQELAQLADLTKVRGVLPVPDACCAGATVDGMRVLSLDDMARLGPHEVDVVVCSFKDQELITQTVRSAMGDSAQLMVPTRRSGMESLFVDLKGKRRMSKGLVLRPLPFLPQPMPIAGRRIVIYGAGSGGREAVDLAAAAGATVIAVCDGDPSKTGSVVAGCSVVPFDTLNREDYDVVVIASRPGLASVTARLAASGLRAGHDFAGLDQLLVEKCLSVS